MKSIVKTTLALTALLTVTGCWDFGWSKKNQESEKTEVATHGQADEQTSKCSHKGCKDKHHKHDDEVTTQGMDEFGNPTDDLDNSLVDDMNFDSNMNNDIANPDMDSEYLA